MKKPLVSIVLPVYNESENLELFYNQLTKTIEQLEPRYNFEMILINDGSVDTSWQIIKSIALVDSRIKAVCLSRNFGHQIALTVGYDVASGDAVICMDTDLQHPTQAIHILLEAWQSGNMIVYVRNKERVHSWLKKKMSDLFYLFFTYIALVDIPRNVQDFRLIDRQVLRVLQVTRERARYLRGLVAWTGFKHTIVEVSYEKRFKGVSGYSWSKMLKLALDGITGFSLFPLKLGMAAGICVVLIAMGMVLYLGFNALIFAVPLSFFKLSLVLLYLFIGLLFFLVGIIGEYVGRMYQEIQDRPMYIVFDHLNLGKNEYQKLQIGRTHAACFSQDVSMDR